jgi:homoserine O-acetyltransferase
MVKRVLTLPFLLFALSISAWAKEPPPLQYAELGDLKLVSGEVIHDAKLGYRTLGRLNSDKTNVVLFPTWFSGTTEDLFQREVTDLVDTSRFYLVVVDALGNGVSSSPSTSARQPGRKFPAFTIRDMVNSQRRLLTEVLGIRKLHAVMGISMGGMQSFEWIIAYPDWVEKAVPVVGSPQLGSYDLLLWKTQLEAIELAQACGCSETGTMGIMSLIMQLALQTPDFVARETSPEEVAELIEQAKRNSSDINDWAAQLRAMIAHDVSKDFGGSMETAASKVNAEVLNVVGIRDHVVTPGPALRFMEIIRGESLRLDNDCGHRAYSCEMERTKQTVWEFLGR